MRKDVHIRVGRPSVGLGLLLGMMVCLLGAAVAILPSGIMARFAIIAFAAISILLAWAFRTRQNSAPEGFLLTGLMMVVSLSVLWPRYIYFHYAGLPSVNIFTLATMAGNYVLVVLMAYSPKFSGRVFGSFSSSGWIGRSVMLWLAWRLFACLLGSTPIYSLVGFVREVIYITSFLLFGSVLSVLDGGPKWLVRMLLICGILVGVAGVIEAFTQYNFFVPFATAGEEGDPSGSLIGIAADKIRGGAFRAQSTFDHPIVFAQYVAALLPLAVYGFLHESSKFWRLVAIVAMPVALLAVAKAGSRAGYGSILVAFGAMGVVLWSRAIAHGKVTKALAIVALPGLVGAIGIGYLLVEELALGRGQVEMSSTAVRLAMLRNGIAALEDSPLWGFGHGLAVLKAGMVGAGGVLTIDNYLLTIALDSGYVGLALLALFLAVFAFRSLTFAVKEPGPDGLFVGACLASVLAIMAAFSVLSIPNNMTLLWLLVTATFPYFGKRASRSAAPTSK